MTAGARSVRARECACRVAIASSAVGATAAIRLEVGDGRRVAGWCARIWGWGHGRLLDVASTFHFAFGGGLCGGQRRIEACRPRQGRRELLPNGRSDTLKLWNCRILHTNIGHRLHRRLVRIGRIDRGKRQLGEGRDLYVFGILIKGGSRSRWHVCPSLLCGDQVGVVSVGGPSDELLGCGNLL